MKKKLEYRLVRWAIAMAAFGFASPSEAQERDASCSAKVTRADVVRCALRANLSVRSEEKSADALRGQRTASAVFLPSNPTLSFSGAQRHGTVPQSNVFNWYATLSQELEIAGQRGTRVRAAEASIAAQEKRIVVTKRDVAARALTAYFEAIAAREEQRLTEKLLATSERMGVVARARADKGVAPTLDAELADAATIRLLHIKLLADRTVIESNAHLSFLLGRSPSTPTSAEGELVPLQVASEARPMNARPELAVYDAERNAMEARADAYRRGRIPNPTLSIYAQNDGFNERVLGVGLALPIPLPSPVGRTYAGQIAEADALAERAVVERERTERELRLAIVDAEAEFTSHRKMVEALTPERLRKAEQSLVDLQAEIEAGHLGVREALVAQQTLIELLQTNIVERRALCLASVELARAAGVPLEEGAR